MSEEELATKRAHYIYYWKVPLPLKDKIMMFLKNRYMEMLDNIDRIKEVFKE